MRRYLFYPIPGLEHLDLRLSPSALVSPAADPGAVATPDDPLPVPEPSPGPLPPDPQPTDPWPTIPPGTGPAGPGTN